MTDDPAPLPPAPLPPPFFIVGCGRSGTTLLRRMLDRHSAVGVPLESLFLLDYLRCPPPRALHFADRMAEEYEVGEWQVHLDPDALKEAPSIRDAIERLHAAYLQKHGKQRWGQKTPRFVQYGNLLKRQWPEAKFVHVIRDPRAVVASLMTSEVHLSNALYGSKRWRRDVGAGLALASAYPGDVLEVRYEDLVSRPAEVLKRVCAFLDLAFEPAMLEEPEPLRREYGRYYDQIHKMVERAPDATRIEAWRKSLTPSQLQLIEEICSPLMGELGYEPVMPPGKRRSLYGHYLKLQRFVGAGRQIAHYHRHRKGYLSGFILRRVRLFGVWRTIREFLGKDREELQ